MEWYSNAPALGSVLYLTIVGSMLGHSLYASLKATNAFSVHLALCFSDHRVGIRRISVRRSDFSLFHRWRLLIIGGILILNLPELRARRTARRVASSA